MRADKETKLAITWDNLVSARLALLEASVKFSNAWSRQTFEASSIHRKAMEQSAREFVLAEDAFIKAGGKITNRR